VQQCSDASRLLEQGRERWCLAELMFDASVVLVVALWRLCLVWLLIVSRVCCVVRETSPVVVEWVGCVECGGRPDRRVCFTKSNTNSAAGQMQI